jgi:NAD(P)-dependent dehydrogenase (short-subunit alcohol dehydrogenase family)
VGRRRHDGHLDVDGQLLGRGAGRLDRSITVLAMTTSVVIGGSSGIGEVIARRFASRGDIVVITSRDASRAEEVARSIGGSTRGVALDLATPADIEAGLAGVPELEGLDQLVITAIEQGINNLANFDVEAATRAVTVKMVGYTEAVRVLRGRFSPSASVVLFGGLAKDRPYPGSTMVSAFNGGVVALVRTLAIELAPHRVNALHPGVVGDSPRWRDVEEHPHIARTPIGRLVTMDEVADATDFLLRNTGINAQNLMIDGGVLAT